MIVNVTFLSSDLFLTLIGKKHIFFSKQKDDIKLLLRMFKIYCYLLTEDIEL